MNAEPASVYILRPACLPGVELVNYRDLRQGTRFVVPWYTAATLRHAHGDYRHRGHSYPCPRDSPVLLNPGELFLAQHVPARDHGAVLISHLQVAPAVLQGAYEESGGRGELCLPIAPRNGPDLSLGLSVLERSLVGEPEPKLGLQEAFALWLDLLLRNAAPGEHRPRTLHEQRAVRRTREILHARLDTELGLDELAAEVGLTKSYLVRAFKQALGIPPHEYQMQLRVAEARRLLSTGMPATEVAHRAGFYDQSHLTRWFKKVVGVTPGAYAQAVR